MKLLMAVSKEGYVQRCREDDMSWTGPFDKAVFRLLSHVGGDLGCGPKTYRLMPTRLQGRTMHKLSRGLDPDGRLHDLLWFQMEHPNGWLIGGQVLAMSALMQDMVDEAFICVSDRKCFPRQDDGEQCLLGTIINDNLGLWIEQSVVSVGDTKVHIWRRNRQNFRAYEPPAIEPYRNAPWYTDTAVFMEKCGCRVGSVCGNAACPYLSNATC
jgi:dihydrofolate reductase